MLKIKIFNALWAKKLVNEKQKSFPNTLYLVLGNIEFVGGAVMSHQTSFEAGLGFWQFGKYCPPPPPHTQYFTDHSYRVIHINCEK